MDWQKLELDYSRLFDDIPAMVWIADTQFNYIYFNKTWRDFSGHSIEKQPHECRESLFDLEERKACDEIYQKALNEKSSFHVIYQMHDVNGKVVQIEEFGNPFYNKNGEWLGFIGTCYDITEKMDALKKLSSKEAELKTILKNTPDIISRFDKELRHVYVSPSITAVTGLTPESMLGMTNRQLGLSPVEITVWEKKLLSVFKNGIGESIEFSFQATEGLRYYEGVLIPEKNAQGDVETVLVINHDITKRQIAEDMHRESYAKYRLLYENSLIGVIILNGDGRFGGANPAFCELIGYTEEELFHLDYSKLSHPEDLKDERIMYMEMFSGKFDRYRMERRYYRKNGTMVWVEIQVSCYKNIHGEIENFICLVENIDERKRAEMLLKEREDLYRRLVENMYDVVYSFDLNGFFTYVSPSITRTFGILPADLVGRSFAQFIHPEDLEKAKNKLMEAYQGKDIITEYRILDDNKNVFWIRTTTHPVYENNQIVGVQGILSDITLQKKAELALAESEEHYRSLLENLNDVVFTINRNSEMGYVSPSIENLIGFRPEEITSRSFIQFVYPDDIERAKSNFYQLMLGEMVTAEYRIIHKSQKEPVWVRTSLRPYIKDGEIVGVQGILSDITLQKKAQEMLEDSNRTLEVRVKEALNELRLKDQMMIQQSRMAAMGEMVNNIAHQWRQPLNALGLSIQNMKEAYDNHLLTEEMANKAYNKMIRLIEHMSNTIDDFRDFMVPDREKIEFSVLDSLNYVVGLIDAGLKNLHLQIEFILKDKFTLYGYPSEFNQVILNILGNAREALQHSQNTTKKITLSLYRDNGRKVVSIKDNAGGIHPDIMDRIFEPYFTTKVNGSGIGLYMSKAIVEKNMGGRISAHNTLDGVEFILEFDNHRPKHQ